MKRVQKIIIVLFMFINFSLFGCEKGNPDEMNDELRALIDHAGDWKNVRKDIAGRILEGANLNAVGQKGETALHETAAFEDYELADFLLCQGANPNINNNQGQTPIFTVSSRYFAELLFSKGACARVMDNYGYTLLHYAMYGDPSLLPLYLEKLAQENYRDAPDQIQTDDFFIGKERICPNTILHTLLLFRITPNTRNIYGETPLHILAQEAPYFIENCEQDYCSLKVQYLLLAGALLNLGDYRGRTPYDIALECIRKEFQSESFPDAQRFLSLFEQKKKVSFFGQLKRFALCY